MNVPRKTSLTLATIASLTWAITSTPALGQIGNPAGMKPDTAEAEPGVPAPGELNTQDRLFLKLATMGNIGEIDASKLAEAKASFHEVKAFARQMSQDHSETLSKLTELVRRHNINVPAEPQPDQKQARARLEPLNGSAFDAAYLQAQLVDHQKTVQLLEWEISNGQNAAVQRLAMETLPIVMDHLRNVQTLLAETTGAAPQGLADLPDTRQVSQPADSASEAPS